MTAGEKGSPFKCSKCTPRNKKNRNCGNHLGLSNEARAVTSEEYKKPSSLWNYATVWDEIKGKDVTKVFTLGDIRLYECPLSYITRESAEIKSTVYLLDGSSNLLYAGGWGDQPAWLVEAVGICRGEEARRMKKDKT